MELLTTFQSLGLPGWFIIAASTIVILHYTGLLKWLTNTLSDVREHSQDLEREKTHYQILQHSWDRDKLADILEQQESFLREQVWHKLEAIESLEYRTERTLSQVRDSTGILAGVLYELKEIIQSDKENDS